MTTAMAHTGRRASEHHGKCHVLGCSPRCTLSVAPKFSQDLGQPESAVAAMVSAIGFGSMCGRIPITALADRCGRPAVYTGVVAFCELHRPLRGAANAAETLARLMLRAIAVRTPTSQSQFSMPPYT